MIGGAIIGGVKPSGATAVAPETGRGAQRLMWAAPSVLPQQQSAQRRCMQQVIFSGALLSGVDGGAVLVLWLRWCCAPVPRQDPHSVTKSAEREAGVILCAQAAMGYLCGRQADKKMRLPPAQPQPDDYYP